MPKWGLTEDQRRMQPWGLDYEYLRPAKVITDPIHGDVFLTRLECLFVDSEAFQRLRRIKQLGNTHLVYPGATHTRFSHSLGAVRVAQDLMDAVVDQRNNPKPVRDLFTEWEEDRTREVARASQRLSAGVDQGGEEAAQTAFEQLVAAYALPERRIAEATIAARLGALLHDLCHVPFGHSIEDELGILDAHDKNVARFKLLWEGLDLPADVKGPLRTGGLQRELRRLILSKEPGANLKKMRYPFVHDIVGNTICADLLDYLERDHRNAGLPVALGRRFVSAFYVTPSGDRDFGQHMILRVTRPDGRERTDVITEVLKYLRYRYELSERVLVHHAKLAADAMVGKSLEMWSDTLWVEHARAFLVDQHVAAKKPSGTFRAPGWLSDRDIAVVRQTLEDRHGKAARDSITDRTKLDLDQRLSRLGDDALLEYLAELESSSGHPRRTEGARALARGVLNRRLYKPIGSQSRTPKSPEKMFAEYGTAEARRRLEEDVARWAGLPDRWQVLVWVAPPDMRLKPAEVLVDGGTGIMTFFEYERRGQRRGSDIYDAHRALWSVGVYLDPTAASDPAARRRVVARVAERMNITFPQYEAEFGNQPHLWPDRLAAATVIGNALGEEHVPRRPDLATTLIEQVRVQQVAARGEADSDSWGAILADYQGAAAQIAELNAQPITP